MSQKNHQKVAKIKVPQGPLVKVRHGSAASHSDSPILNLTGTLIKGSPPTRAERASKLQIWDGSQGYTIGICLEMVLRMNFKRSL